MNLDKDYTISMLPPQEEKYKKYLIALLIPLVDTLDERPYPPSEIRAIVNHWYLQNYDNVMKVIYNHNVKLAEIISKLTKSNGILSKELAIDMSKSDVQMFNTVLMNIEQRYTILNNQIENNDIPEKLIKENQQEIQNNIENGLATFCTQQTLINVTQGLITTATALYGYNGYVGMTQEDDKVRPLHTKYYLNKKIRFDRPPPIGHVGTDFNCRCYILLFIYII